MEGRKSGVLCHITSLPSRFGVGDLGPGAYQFVDFLQASKQKIWQILPLTPTNLSTDSSPYSSPSAFAGNRNLISLEILVDEGLLDQKYLLRIPEFSHTSVRYKEVIAYKNKILAHVISKFDPKDLNYQSFIEEHKFWLDDYADFMTLKRRFGKKYWNKWPEEFKSRDEGALKEFRAQNSDKLNEIKIIQFLFFKQWSHLKNYCYQKGVQILGDIPIYVHFDSVDVWKHPTHYKLDEKFTPRFVAGAPPDAFSATGQRWGNPVYDWAQHQNNHFNWWIKRVHFNLKLYDWVRVDHFRGFINYWEIPYREKTAVRGQWVDVPSDGFFKALRESGESLSIIAEDLGEITHDVRMKINDLKFPGMKILQFAFESDMHSNPYLPHNYDENCVVYTGTHDNNTTVGWFNEMSKWPKHNLLNYLSRDVDPYHGVESNDIHWQLINLAMRSKANWAIFPLQDLLGLDEHHRMNRPGVKKGNWQWRFTPNQLSSNVAQKLARYTKISHRS